MDAERKKLFSFLCNILIFEACCDIFAQISSCMSVSD